MLDFNPRGADRVGPEIPPVNPVWGEDTGKKPEPYKTPENYIDRLSMNLPDELKELKAFLVWRLKPDPKGEKKPGKVPYYINGKKRRGEQGTDQDRAELATFSDAVKAFERGGYAGIGLAMLEDCGLTALDLDHCYSNGKLKPELAALVSDTYTEISPGGGGVRAFYRGTYPKSQDHEAGVEVFPAGQFVTLTGDAIGCNPIIELPADVRRQLDEIFSRNGQRDQGHDPTSDPIFQHLKAHGWVKGVKNGKVNIRCPFEEEHTTASTDGDCAYLPPGGDYKLGNFKCLHSHCINKKNRDFLKAFGLADQGEQQRDQGRRSDGGEAVGNEELQRRAKKVLAEVDPCGPFPLDRLPVIIADYVGEICETTNADPVMVLQSVISTASGLVGKRAFLPKTEYFQDLYCNLWFMSITSSGNFKTTALDKGTHLLHERSRDLYFQICELRAEQPDEVTTAINGGDGLPPEVKAEIRRLQQQDPILPNRATVEGFITDFRINLTAMAT